MFSVIPLLPNDFSKRWRHSFMLLSIMRWLRFQILAPVN